jgi:hypothetical protein
MLDSGTCMEDTRTVNESKAGKGLALCKRFPSLPFFTRLFNNQEMLPCPALSTTSRKI